MRKFFVIAAIVLLFGLVVNQYLGGFKSLDAKIVPSRDIVVRGKMFEGSYKQDDLKHTIDSLRDQISSGKLAGELVIVNYFNDKDEKIGRLKQFVGIAANHSLEDTTSSREVDTRDFALSKVVRTRIPIRGLVMPSPERIKRNAAKVAGKAGKKIGAFSIERYSDQWLIVDIPLN